MNPEANAPNTLALFSADSYPTNEAIVGA